MTRLNRLAALVALTWAPLSQAAVTTPHPIVFVTQVPVIADFTTIGSTFGNHQASMDSAARGGDLWIRYQDGTLKNLTEAAGVSSSGLLGTTAIAVRDPSPHWDGKKILFSAVIGGPSKQYEYKTYYWQLYEMTGLGKDETPVITKVAKQPEDFNNIQPIYGTDDRIIFTTDRPRSGERHLYPQLDEYEEAPTVTGLWSLNPATGDLFMLNHAPSGAFTPQIDSFGRVIFSRWDHLQRDQQADADREGSDYGTFNYASEAADAAKLNDRTEMFPEPRQESSSALYGKVNAHTFNQFFPWQINQDGTGEETLNHVGRHDLGNYGNQSFEDDKNLTYCCYEGRGNRLRLLNDIMLQIKEDPSRPGVFLGASMPEFGTHAAGQIVSLNGAPSDNPDNMTATYLTHPDTAGFTDEGKTPSANHSGLYRDPLPLSDGQLVAAHTTETRTDKNEGTSTAPKSRYDFRLKLLTKDASGYYKATEALTAGITKSLSWWSPDVKVSYNGPLWELNPVELKVRQRPQASTQPLPDPEMQVFTEEGVDINAFKDFLKQNDLALMVSRDVTLRDHSDRQQPYNLRVPGGASSVPKTGRVYDVSHLQFVQADQLRGIGGTTNPRAGRRVIAQPMHDDKGKNRFTGVKNAAAVAPDGSVAAFVPARRAMSWQLTNQNDPVVRERYWLTFQPGEVRVCASCHGINKTAHAGQSEPQNKPESLRQLLKIWKNAMTVSNDDRLFDWAERTFAGNFLPKSATTQTALGYTFRQYSATGEYLGTKDGKVYYYKPAPGANIIDVGTLQQYMGEVSKGGY
ncbi:HzsA-related protein [Parachitinimonas caeni]|uniref:Hydrazine synthase alpha subunit middle domain-containing protein n=1 Tax=Parachitinimonas caeni TaxID=3031301 RepID=A0ABT7DYN6_9NEIS|nr:hypothetical protein [Parachitinimonas caeni]MDK2123777.1 hypothetical protein [Parachitinimonas caeni]